MIPDPPLAGLEARVRELEQVVAEKVVITMMVMVMLMLITIMVMFIIDGDHHCIAFNPGEDNPWAKKDDRGSTRTNTEAGKSSTAFKGDHLKFNLMMTFAELWIKIFQWQIFPGTSSPWGFSGLIGGSGGRQLWRGPVEDKPARRIVISRRKNKRQSNLWSSHAVVQLCFVEDL